MGLYLPCGRGDAKLTRGGFNGEQCCGGLHRPLRPYLPLSATSSWLERVGRVRRLHPGLPVPIH